MTLIYFRWLFLSCIHWTHKALNRRLYPSPKAHLWTQTDEIWQRYDRDMTQKDMTQTQAKDTKAVYASSSLKDRHGTRSYLVWTFLFHIPLWDSEKAVTGTYTNHWLSSSAFRSFGDVHAGMSKWNVPTVEGLIDEVQRKWRYCVNQGRIFHMSALLPSPLSDFWGSMELSKNGICFVLRLQWG